MFTTNYGRDVHYMMEMGELLTAMVTPFKENLDVDYEMTARLAEKLVEEGSDGLVVVGTTGESPTITHNEKIKLFKTVKKAVGTMACVIAGTGSNSTRTTIELSKEAEDIGVDGILLVAPYYNKPPQEGLYEHYAQVANSVSLPIILYNIPGRTGVNISNEVIEKLHREFSNIVAVKDATGNLEQTSDLALRTNAVAGISKLIKVKTSCSSDDRKRDFRIYSGDDSLTLPILACGGTGVISVTSHLAGRMIKNMIINFFEGKVKEAKKLHLELFPLFKALFLTTNPIMVKEALNIKGFNVGGVRPPLVGASKEYREKITKVMKDLKII